MVDARDLKSLDREVVRVRDPLRVLHKREHMRTVRDAKGVSWICLELPTIPADQQAAAEAHVGDVVAIECNSGAERVIAIVNAGWDDDLSDAQLNETITRFLR
jgi:hypothetical protein